MAWFAQSRTIMRVRPLALVLIGACAGGGKDLKQAFVTGFEATTLDGGWTLKVEDDAANDIGTINAWQLEVTTH